MSDLDIRAGRGQRSAVRLVFFAHGVVFASWAAHIPQVKAHLHLSDATLGLALLGPPVGSVMAMAVAGFLLPRVGSRRMVQAALAGYCLSACLVGVAGSPATLFAALALWGAFQGALDVAMNTQAIVVEQAQRRPLMFGFHGGWSIGAFVGAGIGVAGVALHVSLAVQLLALGAVTLAVVGARTRQLASDSDRPDRPDRPSDPGRRTAPDRPHRPDRPDRPSNGRPADHGRPGRGSRRAIAAAVLVLGGIAFASMLCEGAAADWSAVYLRGTLHRGPSVSGLGYAAFSLAIVAARLSGNRLLARTSPRRLLPGLGAVATVGFATALLAHNFAVALVGFATLGLGVALVVPAVFSAAGRIPGLHPGRALATVSACGWAGFMCGPPLVGWLASEFSLPVALALVPVLTAFMAAAIAASRALDRIATDVDGPWEPATT